MLRTISLLVVASTVSAALGAQESTYRHSTWGSIGAGIAPLELDCPPCRANSNVAPTVFVRLGGTINNRWTAAVDFAYRPGSERGRTTKTYAFTGAAYFYPMLDSGFNLNVGGGGMVTTENGGGEDISMNGLLLRIGAGYDVFLSQSLAITPYVTYFRGRGITGKRVLTDPATGAMAPVVFATPNLGVDLLHIGLALTKP